MALENSVGAVIRSVFPDAAAFDIELGDLEKGAFPLEVILGFRKPRDHAALAARCPQLIEALRASWYEHWRTEGLASDDAPGLNPISVWFSEVDDEIETQ